MKINLSERLYGSQWTHILQEFFTNTVHFPIATLLLELILEGKSYFYEVDGYILIIACCLQAYYLGTQSYKKQPRPLLGNLITPILYTLFELFQTGLVFFEKPNHLAFWFFSLSIALLQSLRLHFVAFDKYLLVTESVLRMNIILVMYWIYGILTNQASYNLFSFFDEGSHIFLFLTMNLMGVMLGIAQYHAYSFLQLLRTTTRQLQCYSEWFLGEERLAGAVVSPSILSLARKERTVLFMDIRGFTQWSENNSPEIVVEMIHDYCKVAEQNWLDKTTIKIKLTGDEIMMVFTTAEEAFQTALALQKTVNALLQPYQLTVGIGVHTGILIEGLIGSETLKTFDVFGDTVNTAKRICDNATGGEILLSTHSLQQLIHAPQNYQTREIKMKGKATALTVICV